MNIVIIGSGGREHALAWKIKQSPKVKNIFVLPGNAGTAKIAQNINVSKTNEIIDWIKNNSIDLVVVGPDNYLAEGIVDQLEKLNIPTFGPTIEASKIEWSKSFAKQFMTEENIPTAKYQVFTEIKKAEEYLKNQEFPVVIKASGLAFGKGVVIAKNIEEATETLNKILEEKIFGDAGKEIIIEEYLEGKEISIHAFCDGKNVIMFPPSQDHKRIFDGDNGPNTGGMGTIAPVPQITEKQMEEIKTKIVIPTINALKKRNSIFKGILFPGIMLTKNGPRVIEFNARFGDPEAQSYIRILETDLVEIIFACINGTLKNQKIKWSSKSACCIICASGGYPDKYQKDKVISGLDSILDLDKEIVIFHSGTKFNKQNNAVTNGGRVLGITSTGKNLGEALSRGYEAIKSISFENMHYRKDIGSKSL